jgi:dUTP pyrophosphatase
MNDNTLYFAKVHPEAIIPTKREEDGCYDIYVIFDDNEITIKPHEIKTFNTGLAMAVSSKYRLDFQRERGSTGSIAIVPRCGQVDSGYRGEVFLKLQNTSDNYIVISKDVTSTHEKEGITYYPYSKAVCQMAVEVVPVMEEEVISFEKLQEIPSLRGTGSLGSSGK